MLRRGRISGFYLTVTFRDAYVSISFERCKYGCDVSEKKNTKAAFLFQNQKNVFEYLGFVAGQLSSLLLNYGRKHTTKVMYF